MRRSTRLRRDDSGRLEQPIRGRERRNLVALFWVGLGGFFGSIARYTISVAAAARWGPLFPWGTFVINITGSFILGFFMAFAHYRPWLHAQVRLLFAVGFVGAYTTFSTYTYESLRLMMDGQFVLAALNVTGSVVVGLAAVFAGFMLGDYI
jgi:CrcB protein